MLIGHLSKVKLRASNPTMQFISLRETLMWAMDQHSHSMLTNFYWEAANCGIQNTLLAWSYLLDRKLKSWRIQLKPSINFQHWKKWAIKRFCSYCVFRLWLLLLEAQWARHGISKTIRLMLNQVMHLRITFLSRKEVSRKVFWRCLSLALWHGF